MSNGERYALIFKPSPHDDSAPVFLCVAEDRLEGWLKRKWFLLGRESDLVFADLEDVREDDERGRR
jgi:hypothetical protein